MGALIRLLVIHKDSYQNRRRGPRIWSILGILGHRLSLRFLWSLSILGSPTGLILLSSISSLSLVIFYIVQDALIQML